MSRPGCGCCRARDDAPAELARQLWDLPGVGGDRPPAARRDGCRRPTFPVGSWWPRRWCATCSTDPMLPAELLPADWPGARLRDAYHDFATELAQRREPTQLVEAT